MKNILGLDLGTNSIGWAIIKTDENTNNPQELVALGDRIIPLSPDDSNEFSTGNAISKNMNRTKKRNQRKCYDRYQQRRTNLLKMLHEKGMAPTEALIKLPLIKLWQLRADAATEGKQLSLQQIGRVLYLLNQKRGYLHSKSDDSDTKQKEYVAGINKRFSILKSENKTIGQYLHNKLLDSAVINASNKTYYTYRIKDNIYPRQAYIEEFNKIMSVQRNYYPDILTDDFIHELRDSIIYYQRGLKSCKHLVALCEFEKKETFKDSKGNFVLDGPKVTPKSNPLFQICKIWESINNIVLKNKYGQTFNISLEKKKEIFFFMDNHEKMRLTDLFNILEIKRSDGWWGGKAIGNGLQGNITKIQLKKALNGITNSEDLLRFNIQNEDSEHIDESTGEILQIIDNDYQKEPLYRLWHIIYSISDKKNLTQTLAKQFNITDEETINRLFHTDFVKMGYGNKSAKAIRKILPYLQQGYMYSDACLIAGFKHSDNLTNKENESRLLLEKLPLLEKNELHQPVVEKILNQMINIINAIIDKYGKIDEVRIELARELKQSKEERFKTDKNMRLQERMNREISKKIEEFDIRPSRNNIQKYKLWEESGHRCFYCGEPINVKEFLLGFDVETEHVIPKSLLFDDSFSNKVCACRKCNRDKNNRTAYDFMKTKSNSDFEDYINRVAQYYSDQKISKSKRDNLLMSKDKLPSDFINRQLRQSQYIARKSQDILRQVCRNVYSTSGSVTDFVRHVWGYDEILNNINIERYRKANLTENVEYYHRGLTHIEERIKDWTKRMDHRHHAIDALVIACTKQSYIQRLNNLSASRDMMFAEVSKQSEEWKEKYSLLEEWMLEQTHFTTAMVSDKIEQLIVSFKSGKKVASKGKRYGFKNGKRVLLQNGIIVPRGALSEEFIYGKIQTIEKNKPLKYIFENSNLIINSYIQKLVQERIRDFDGDIKKAITSLQSKPLYIDMKKTIPLQYASCYKPEYVIKYPISSLKKKDLDSIIDLRVKSLVKERLEKFGNNEKLAFEDINNNPIYYDNRCTIPIRSVRCYTNLSAVYPLRTNEQGKEIGFVKSGNNHHIAFYYDENDELQEHLVTFWHAVERKMYGIPVVITDPLSLWNMIENHDYPDFFLKNLPDIKWKYKMSIQQNEMFILGLSEDEFQDAIQGKDLRTLNNHLYRVQNISSSAYRFILNTCTQFDLTKANKLDKRFYNIQSIKALLALNPHKVKVSILGDLTIDQQ